MKISGTLIRYLFIFSLFNAEFFRVVAFQHNNVIVLPRNVQCDLSTSFLPRWRKKKRDLKAAYATLKKNSSADGKFYGAC